MKTDNLNAKPGSLSTWLDYLEGINPDKIELGLSRVKSVYDRLNLNLLNEIPVIEVAGTNGKGSTAALIAASLNYSGIKAGLYTSPHLHKFNERVVIGGVEVSDDELTKAFKFVHENCKDIKLTYFEYTTLAALVCFVNANVKAVVLEVGLGGRLDAVNVVDANISVITSIGLDHTHILGDTVEKIAFEKAGIIKNNSQVVTGIIDEKALKVIKDVAFEKSCELYCETVDFFGSFTDGFSYVQKTSINQAVYHFPYPKIPYCCAPVALRVLTLLKEKGLKITHDGVKKAVQTVSLPGRMQLVHFNPVIFLDVAHNPPAATHLVDVLSKRKKIGNRIALIGMLKDKDVESVIAIIKNSFDIFYVASLHTQRGEKANRLVDALVKNNVPSDKIKSYETVALAMTDVLADAMKNDEIIVLGSFVTVTEASDALNNK